MLWHSPMSDLVACPFCRQLFEPGEATACPDCGLGLKDLAKLPPSYDAKVEYPEEPVPPHMETLPWTYAGPQPGAPPRRSRWRASRRSSRPGSTRRRRSCGTSRGYGLARMLGFYWAPAVAWFVLFPLVLTRRSIYKMRGARVAVAFLAGIALVTVASLLARPPHSSALRPVHIEWRWGIYAAGAAALAAVLAAFGFGGRLDDVPTKQIRKGDETLH